MNATWKVRKQYSIASLELSFHTICPDSSSVGTVFQLSTLMMYSARDITVAQSKSMLVPCALLFKLVFMFVFILQLFIDIHMHVVLSILYTVIMRYLKF